MFHLCTEIGIRRGTDKIEVNDQYKGPKVTEGSVLAWQEGSNSDLD